MIIPLTAKTESRAAKTNLASTHYGFLDQAFTFFIGAFSPLLTATSSTAAPPTTSPAGSETERFALRGFGHCASQLFIDASACRWTASTVASAVPARVLRSEQWKPSLIAMGSHDVLGKYVPSADLVASRQGSPVDGKQAEANLSARSPGLRETATVRTVAIGEEEVGNVHEPAIVC